MHKDNSLLKETEYLFSSKANSKRIKSSLEKIKAGNAFERELINED